MPKTAVGINSFNAGEVSPYLYNRWDIQKYQSACKTLQNALPMVEGGVRKMPGTVYVCLSAESGKKSRLIPFVHSSGQAYALEFTHRKIRVFANDGPVVTSSSANDYDPATYYNVGDIVRIRPYYYMLMADQIRLLFIMPAYDQDIGHTTILAIPNTSDSLSVVISGTEPFQQIIIKYATTTPSKNAASLIQTALRACGYVNGISLAQWTVTPNYPYYVNPGGFGLPGFDYDYWQPYELKRCIQQNQYYVFPNAYTHWETVTSIPSPQQIIIDTPYDEADLFDIDASLQSGDVLYLFHPKYPAQKLKRYGHTSWTLEECQFTGTPDIGLAENKGQIKKITAISKANPCVVTCPNHGFSQGDKIFINGVSGMIEINEGTYTITNVPNVNTINLQLDSTDFTTYTSGGYCVKVVPMFNYGGWYPSCGTIHNQRLILSGFPSYPHRIYGSVIGDLESFIFEPELDDYAFQFDLASQSGDGIRWMAGRDKLFLGTQSGIWTLGAQDGMLSARNVQASKQIAIGASTIQPVRVGDSVVWISRVARSVRIIVYDIQTDRYIAPDLTRLARHILLGTDDASSGAVQIMAQSEPYPLLWCVKRDGTAACMTLEMAEQVYAWFRVVLSGVIESICVIPRANSEDRVWAVINRNGTRCIEYFSSHEIFGSVLNGNFLECSSSWAGKTAQITGISKANPAVVTAPGHGLSDGDRVRVTAFSGMQELSQTAVYTVTNASQNSFALSGVDSTSYSDYIGGGIVLQVTDTVTNVPSAVYLDGDYVSVVADGIYVGEYSVASGSVSFGVYANRVSVGRRYMMIVEPLAPAVALQQGPSAGKKQRINRVTIGVHDTNRLRVGTSVSDAKPIYVKSDSVINHPHFVDGVLKGGLITVDVHGDWTEQGSVCIVHDEPYPATITCIIPHLTVNEI